jgi:peptidoglycan/LPS O-acetylase OafA/YrhL
MITPKVRQIVGIDLIRFFAALLVMLFHLCYWIWAGGPDVTTPAAAKAAIQFQELAFLRYGGVGVQIFCYFWLHHRLFSKNFDSL